MIHKNFQMTQYIKATLFFLFSLGIGTQVYSLDPNQKHIPQILGRTQIVDIANSGSSNQIELQNYWRSNIIVSKEAIESQKKPKASHVPGLIEYRIYVTQSGTYKISFQSDEESFGLMHLTINGVNHGKLFENSQSASPKIENLDLHQGYHLIRLTSAKVNTPIPQINEISITFETPKEIPAPIQTKLTSKESVKPDLEPGWEQKISRKIHLDFHTAAYVDEVGNKWNPDEFASTLAENHVNAITVFAKGHHGFAYYDTKIGTRHPGLDFDLLKEQIEACHKKGIMVLAYFSINLDELWATTEESDNENRGSFQGVDANPENIYISEYTWPMIQELVENYDIDGFWFDFPGYDSFVTETINLIRSLKPDLISAYNHQFDKPREELAKMDVMEIEAWMHSQSLYRLPYIARYAHGSTPITAMSTRFWHMWGDFGRVNDEALLTYETAVSYANGIGLTIGDQLHPNGRLEPAVYKVIGQAYQLGKLLDPYVHQASFVPYVAYLRQDLTGSAVVLDNGIHFNVVDENQSLDQYKALIIPKVQDVSEQYVSKLSEFVNNGGKIIAFGDPPSYMESILGVKKYELIESPFHEYRNMIGGFVRNRDRVLKSAAAMDILIKQKPIGVKPTGSTKTIAPLVFQMNYGTDHRLSHQQSPPKDEASEYAAITHRKLGKGEIIFSPLAIPQDYATDGFTQNRYIVKDMFDMVVPSSERYVEFVDSKVNLEVSILEQEHKNRFVIQLVHAPQSRRATLEPMPVIDEFPMVQGTVLKIHKQIIANRSVRIVTQELQELKPIKVDDFHFTYEIPDFSINTVLVIE
ncbi:MAG: alpha-L-fucosidase [Flavobacteriaceae bacterium]|nr:alpha-L-fucosidase [Flavobacteriaceae bacterium]